MLTNVRYIFPDFSHQTSTVKDMASGSNVTSGGDGNQSDDDIPDQNVKRRKLDGMIWTL